jgi:ribosome maturation factor RimP
MMLKDIEQEVARIISPVLEREAFELVDVEFRSECGRWVLRIYIDKPGGVRVEDCASISHRIGDLIEVEELITRRYSLEVSSPGLDRVLKKESDFQRFLGRAVKVVLREGLEGRKNFKGTILQCGDGLLDLEDMDGHRHRLALGEIKKAKLEIEL